MPRALEAVHPCVPMLTVGSRLSLAGELTGTAFRQSQNRARRRGVVVVALYFALFLVRLMSSNDTEY